MKVALPAAPLAAPISPATKESGTGFREVLTLSRHAQRRLNERNIGLDAGQSHVLQAAMAEARKAGSKQAAVVMPHAVFVVAPGSGTVITGIDRETQPMAVVTNVDTVVVVGRSSPGAPRSRPTDGTPTNALPWQIPRPNGGPESSS